MVRIIAPAINDTGASIARLHCSGDCFWANGLREGINFCLVGCFVGLTISTITFDILLKLDEDLAGKTPEVALAHQIIFGALRASLLLS